MKNIFIVWFQGWDKAPTICKDCVESWRTYNPQWKVNLLDEKDIRKIIGDKVVDNLASLQTIQQRTDMMRLMVLSKNPGVYTDATNFCNRSLDSWIHETTKNTDYWFAWDVDSQLPTINFFYNKGSNSFDISVKQTYNFLKETGFKKNKGWGFVNRSFSKRMDPKFVKSMKKNQLGVSSNNTKPKKGVKMMANSFRLMNSPVNDRFEKAVLKFPFFKLTWKFGKWVDKKSKNKDIPKTFLPNSKVRYIYNKMKSYDKS
jgi:hypothetical protein